MRQYGKTIITVTVIIMFFSIFTTANAMFNNTSFRNYIGQQTPNEKDNIGAITEDLISSNKEDFIIDTLEAPEKGTLYYINSSKNLDNNVASLLSVKPISANVKIIKITKDNGEDATVTNSSGIIPVLYIPANKDNNLPGDGTITFNTSGYFNLIIEISDSDNENLNRKMFKVYVE